MSSSTWTRAELLSEAQGLEGLCWRVVEAQFRVSTMKLTDSADEQAALEALIEATKPQIPEDCRHLNFLLYTPFRYAAYPFNSRFRRAGSGDGVFYGAERPGTAIAEKAFFRLLFFVESPHTPWPANPGDYTVFAAQFAVSMAIDLTAPPLVRFRTDWTSRTDYSACLKLADAARAEGIQAIRYESVRDPDHRENVALFSCSAFKKADPVSHQTWRMHFSATGVRAICEFPKSEISFDRNSFASDPRIKEMRWDR
jgi:hypothetical protein